MYVKKLLGWKKTAASLLGLGVWCDDVPLLVLVLGISWKTVALIGFGLWESRKKSRLE